MFFSLYCGFKVDGTGTSRCPSEGGSYRSPNLVDSAFYYETTSQNGQRQMLLGFEPRKTWAFVRPPLTACTFVTSSLLVTTSKALVTRSDALVTSSFLLLLVRHLLLEAMHLLLVASCYY